MSAEDRFYKQLEGIVSSIIRALEGLEKEFSEYIEVTNKRLKILEEKILKIESLADVSGKGLVKAIDESTNQEEIKELTHLTQKISPEITQKDSFKQTIPEIQDKTTFAHPIPKIETQDSIQENSQLEIPSVPTPPPIQTTIETKPVVEKLLEEEVIPQPQKTVKVLEKESKKDDKDELMDALKTIDNL